MNTLIQEAIKLVEAGETEKGLNTLSKAEKQLHDEDKVIAAQLYYEWGNADKAISLISDLHDLYPEETELTNFYAELLIDIDEEEKALAVLETIPETDASYPESLLLMADLYQMQGLFEVSEQKLLKAKSILEDEPVIDFALGELYYTQGAYAKAIQYFKRTAEEQSEIGGVNVHQRLAESLSASGEFEEAIPWYEKAVEETPEPNTIFGYGFTASQAGFVKTAIKQLSDLKEIDPSYSSLYMPLAESYEAEGMYEEALKTAKEGISYDEYNKELFLYAAKMTLKIGNVQEGKKLLQEALALDPGYVEALHTLLAVYLKEEDYELIIDLIQEVRGYGEEDPKYNWYLASAYTELEKYEEAKKCFEAAYLHYREDRDFLYEYANFLLEEGLQQEALPLLKEVLILDGANEELEETILRIEDEFSR
ncbi:tetratricopeptide repeat protein [Bacillus atrophaeus]|uniref:tetratricopeptide repeat protein n=1 Tax=Bacillus atrophaeus TaxID=1452 RepID=UPI00255B4C2C|nr:tetratricopeptide repeat protein [Bacillus atrophaeus]MDL5141895.1 tetratricopeptide repeat protein [Bacillus atrophaeus]